MLTVEQDPQGIIRARNRALLVRMLVYLGGALKAAGAPDEILEHVRAAFRWLKSQEAKSNG